MSILGTTEPINQIIIYTDGGCYNTASVEAQGIGAWAYVRLGDKDPVIVAERNTDTTNNRMELLAVIHAIIAQPEHAALHIITDSEYVVNGITSWVDGWIHNGWKTINHKNVLNRDLWQILHALTYHYSIKWTHIRGHHKCPNKEQAYWNGIADNACTWAMHNTNDEIQHYLTIGGIKYE